MDDLKYKIDEGIALMQKAQELLLQAREKHKKRYECYIEIHGSSDHCLFAGYVSEATKELILRACNDG